MDRYPEIGRTLTRIRSVMNGITEWMLASFVGGYITGLVSGIFIFIKIHHRIPATRHTEESASAHASRQPRYEGRL
jgi:hypothetical protein